MTTLVDCTGEENFSEHRHHHLCVQDFVKTTFVMAICEGYNSRVDSTTSLVIIAPTAHILTIRSIARCRR